MDKDILFCILCDGKLEGPELQVYFCAWCESVLIEELLNDLPSQETGV